MNARGKSSVLLVQEYLRTHSLADLAAEHGVYSRIEKYKFSLNYDMIEAKNTDPLACQCRGLVLRTHDARAFKDDEIVGETVVLARPMDRFFNFGMSEAAKVDFHDPETVFFEKLDGTQCIVYWDDIKVEWCVATRSVCEANLPIDGFGEHTFRSLFERALKDTCGMDFIDFVPYLNNKNTYCFELTTPLNQVVVRHLFYRVWLLSVRRTGTGKEYSLSGYTSAQGLGRYPNVIPTAPRHVLRSLNDLLEFVEARNGTEHEGVVVCDREFNRVKVKSAAYVAAHRTVSTACASPRAMLELVLAEQMDDVLPLLNSEKRAFAEKMTENLRDYLYAFNETWQKLYASVPEHLSDRVRRKEFAMAVQEAGLWMAPAMYLYEGKGASIQDWLAKQHKSDTFLDKLLSWINVA